MRCRETMPTSCGPRTTGKSSCREWTQRASASASVSEGESVAKSVSITSRIRTVSTTDWKKTPWSSICAPIMMKKPAMTSQGVCSSMPPTMAASASTWPRPAAKRPAGANPCLRAKLPRSSRPQSSGYAGTRCSSAQAGLHPHHAAQQIGGGDERLVEKLEIAAGAQKGSGQHQRRGQVGQRTGQRHGKLPAALVGVLLAFGIGVGKQAADGQQQNGAQPQSQPRRHQQPRGLPHHHRRHQHQKQAQAARHAVGSAQPQANDRQQREKGVDAHLHAHPTAQRD